MPSQPARRQRTVPLQQGRPQHQSGVLVVRSERRSWITIGITAFGALLLRYLKTVRERAFNVRPSRRIKGR